LRAGRSAFATGLWAFPLATAGLAALSLYRESLGLGVSYLSLLTLVLVWTTQATSWNILSGFSGYFSFGQAAYVGTGAYATAVLYGRHGVSFYLTLLVAAGLCALLALAIGALAFRLRSLRGEIFALLTLAVPFILGALARTSRAIDGGQGIPLPVPTFPAQVGLFQDFLYLVALGVAAGAVWTAFAIAHSRSGWALAAIRDAEAVAEGLGVATFRYKLLALVASAVIGGVGGSVFALYIGFVTVESVFNLNFPLLVIVMSVLGGRTHWPGPVIGAVLVVVLQNRLASSRFESWQLIMLGAILAVLVAVAPEGLTSGVRRRRWPVLGALLGTTVILGLARAPGQPLDWILVGMLVAAAVAVWPGRRRRAPAVSAPTDAPAGAPAARESTPRAPAAPAVLVDCRKVARYFGGVHALEDVTLRIHEGEIVGLVGPNGSGKTTLVSLLSGSLRPTRGHILVAGHDTRALAPHRVAHAGIARTYQIPRPFASMTVRDNVALAVMFGRVPSRLIQARARAEQHIEFVGLGHLAGALPSALNLHQRQLLEIARALATEPKLLLLDEALAGLNPAEIDSAVEVVRRVHRAGTAIVIVEHLLRVVNQLATRVVVLDRGTVLADGAPRAVMSDPAVIQAYLGRSGARA
jgi:ABC-type branched-subunit amino acid transport system ATPase component/ABC-type branched-subunit amino acid transport system permease subunit